MSSVLRGFASGRAAPGIVVRGYRHHPTPIRPDIHARFQQVRERAERRIIAENNMLFAPDRSPLGRKRGTE